MTTYANTKRCLALLEPTTQRLPARWRPIVEEVCAEFRVCLGDVMAGWRGRKVVKARHAVWQAIHDRFGSPLAEIGRRFGFHHTSVMHGIEMHQQRVAGVCEQQY